MDELRQIGVPRDGRHRRKKTLEQHIYHWLSDEWCGNDVVPASTLSHEIERFDGDTYKVASILDDGFALYLGYSTEWKFNITRSQARSLAWFIIWDWWVKGEWFGLRRRAWYWLLRRRVNR